MGIIEFLFRDSKMTEITTVMCFGCIAWIFAMRELLKKEKVTDDDKYAANSGGKHNDQADSPAMTLTYITKEQIMELTAEQLREIPESEVDKLPTVLRGMFRRRKNEVLLEDRAKNSR